MYGDLGSYGDFGAADNVTALEQTVAIITRNIAAQKRKVATLKKQRSRAKLFSRARAKYGARLKAEEKQLRSFLISLKRAKSSLAAAKKAAGKRGLKFGGSKNGGALTAREEQLIKQLIESLKAQGVDEDDAEEAAKEKVLPPQKRSLFPRGFFRGLQRRGPRPSLPTTHLQFFRPVPGTVPGPTRSIDPTLNQRDIDPVLSQRSIDPNLQQRSLDPFVPSTGFVPQDGAFTFPPGNLTDVDPDVLTDGLDGIVDTVKEYAAKPWVMGLALLGAVLYGPKLLAKLKGKKARKNPRRRVRHNRRR